MAEQAVQVLVKDIRRLHDLEPSDTIPDGTSLLLDHPAWIEPRRGTPALVQAILRGTRVPLLQLEHVEPPLPLPGVTQLYAEGANVHAVLPDGTDYVMRAVGRSSLTPVPAENVGDATEVLVTVPGQEEPFLLRLDELAMYVQGEAPIPDEIVSWE